MSQHTKTHHFCTTSDGWRLHMVRTSKERKSVARLHPIVLIPGLGSSGVYTFDLSPDVSLADYLAEQDWDVWVVELRGNGSSDKPQPLGRRSRWWTIDDNIAKDVPALLTHILAATGAPAAHVMGHSMGGMILVGALARGEPRVSGRIRSGVVVGSGCFLEGSWWGLLAPLLPVTPLLYTVPCGLATRAMGNVALSPLSSDLLDKLYFWPPNTTPRRARKLLLRNFSDISPGVTVQLRSGFTPEGLSTYDGKRRFADPAALAGVTQPLLFICGDKDRMCPPQGAKKTLEQFSVRDKTWVEAGPAAGFSDHYGHFDVLMGKNVEVEVFPLLHNWLQERDGPMLSSL